MKRSTPQTADSDASSKRQFSGSANPRALLILNVLHHRPVSREALDKIAGCANGPDLVAGLRSRGLGQDHLPCEQIQFVDRDGYTCRPGVYSLTEKGRRMVYAWMARRKKECAQKAFSNIQLDGFDGPL
jgi:hypothetical protein